MAAQSRKVKVIGFGFSVLDTTRWCDTGEHARRFHRKTIREEARIIANHHLRRFSADMLFVDELGNRLRELPQVGERKRVGDDRTPTVCTEANHKCIYPSFVPISSSAMIGCGAAFTFLPNPDPLSSTVR